ncbi:hypothetical protein [Thermosulfurimonas sp. F29]|uniref:hypothetical protein n=1 Tax=Thermosulfurimonas sp. F29 TaxID=2867247 RepID=UPI001C83E849|nr:hypothetical protein [Thermosulfurimonas sp. F29]MBX6423390.1 hypothetical protein [Thermosulfurimonas sp. F29]
MFRKRTLAGLFPLFWPEDSGWCLSDGGYASPLVEFRGPPLESLGENDLSVPVERFASLLRGRTGEFCVSWLLASFPFPDAETVRGWRNTMRTEPPDPTRFTMHRRVFLQVSAPFDPGRFGDDRSRMLAERRALRTSISALLDEIRRLGAETRPLSHEETLSAVALLLHPYRWRDVFWRGELPPRFDPVRRLPVLSDTVFLGEGRFFYDGYCFSCWWLANFRRFDAEDFWQAWVEASDLREEEGCASLYLVHFTPPHGGAFEEKLKTEASLARATAFGRAREDNLLKSRAIEAFLRAGAERGETVVQTAGYCVVCAPDVQLLRRAETRIRSAFSAAGVDLYCDVGYAVEARFVWPFGAGYRIPESRRLYLLAGQSARITPGLFGSFVGDRENPVILGRNRQGEPCGFNPVSSRAAKWCGFIVAPSGSGKTFLAQNLIAGLWRSVHEPFIGVVDFARYPSYQALIETLGGDCRVVSLDEDTEVLNPLEYPIFYREPPEDLVAFLSERFFPAALEGMSMTERKLLEKAIRRAYRIRLDLREQPRAVDPYASPAPEFLNFHTYLEARDFYAETWRRTRKPEALALARLAHAWALPRPEDLLEVLQSPGFAVTEEDRRDARSVHRRLTAFLTGARDRIFNRAPAQQVVFRSDPFYVWGGRLLGFRDLCALVFMLVWRRMLYWSGALAREDQVDTGLLDEREQRLFVRKKVFIVDEFHNLRGVPAALAELVDVARQGRTINVSAWLISQSLSDLDAEQMKIFAENSGFKVFLRLTSPENPQTAPVNEAAEFLGLDERRRELLRSLTLTSRYSEAFVVMEGLGAGVLRFVPSAEERWIGTTRREETVLRDACVRMLLQEMPSLPRRRAFLVTVRVLAEFYPEGAPGEVSPEAVRERFLRRARDFLSATEHSSA